MLERRPLKALEDFFLPLSKRPDKGIYFVRINGSDDHILQFLSRYDEAARRNGVIQEGKIPNPSEGQLGYYQEIMGNAFAMDLPFLSESLKRWLPRLTSIQRNNVTNAMKAMLENLRLAGKNENMLRNAYVKYMCWLYYRFERVICHMGTEDIPKILYQGTISSYELQMLVILAQAGCDIVLIQPQGDEAYQKLDPTSFWSQSYPQDGLSLFLPDFSLKDLRKKQEKKAQRERLLGGAPQISPRINTWISGDLWQDLLTPIDKRGPDGEGFYTVFGRIHGVADRLTWPTECRRYCRQISQMGRKMILWEGRLPTPTAEEIASIPRKQYRDAEQMIDDLASTIRAGEEELRRLMVTAFVRVMEEEVEKNGENLNRLISRAVYLLCYNKRYQEELFHQWKPGQIPCLLYLGGCQNAHEGIFLRFLAELPVDILILVPDLCQECILSSPLLFEKKEKQSLSVEHFPREDAPVRMGTAAYHAQKDLDSFLYDGSAFFREQQYARGKSLTLRTMAEEIRILWDQELRYRPGFEVENQTVHMPVLAAKISGIRGGDIARYWTNVRFLCTPDTYVITAVPFILSTDVNPAKPYAVEFLKKGRLLREKIKAHPTYAYAHLREERQNHILDCLQILLDQRWIRGTFENGTEYTIVSTVLNLNKELLRLLQRFDFTKKNPKLLYICATEKVISLEDSILTAFLHLAGFDVIFLVPTGYQSIEKHFARSWVEEHIIGEYRYDLPIPNLEAGESNRSSWMDKFLKRGNGLWD